jgi:hypothetical protein
MSSAKKRSFLARGGEGRECQVEVCHGGLSAPFVRPPVHDCGDEHRVAEGAQHLGGGELAFDAEGSVALEEPGRAHDGRVGWWWRVRVCCECPGVVAVVVW